MEGLTKYYGVTIAVTEETRALAPDLAYLEIDRVRVIGRAAPVTIHALVGDNHLAQSTPFADYASWHASFLYAYRSQDFATALSLLDQSRPELNADLNSLYALYAERIKTYLTAPPETGWDGTFTAQTK